MTSGQQFCTVCGGLLVPDTRFCGHCGHPVEGQDFALQGTAIRGGPERMIGIVPFVEQGIISVIHYTLLVTSQRLIFCTWNPYHDEAMSDADDELTEESCNIAETSDEIVHFRAKDWATGPWQRYRSMPIDTIVAGAPGSITIPLAGIAGVDIVCETSTSTQDNLSVNEGGRHHSFDLMYSQGPFLYSLLQPLLIEKVCREDHL